MPNKYRRTMLIMLLALGLLAAGCAQSNDQAGAPIDPPPVTVSPPVTQEADKEAEETEPKKDLQISSQSEDRAEQTSAASKEQPELPNYNISEPFDTTRPALMGFSIGDSLDAIIARFGNPVSESTMNDGGLLKILEYPGFSFGVNEDHSVVFIEVFSDQISPGLNQFRVGQTVEQAQKALGPADSLNDYVMIYEFDKLVLKCDLNPNDNTVIAIKLFAA